MKSATTFDLELRRIRLRASWTPVTRGLLRADHGTWRDLEDDLETATK